MKEIVTLIRGITRPVVTLLLVSAVVGLALMSRTVPEALVTLTATAVGYWFGQHVTAKDG